MKDIKVLIVEDEALIAQQLKKRLLNLEYRISGVVASTKEAMESLRDNPADLVLMDIVIKGDTDGIDAAGLIQHEFNLPVIFLTAYADEKTLQRAELARAYGYLVKPVQERELNAMIRIVLNRHARDRELLETIAAVEKLGKTLGATAGRLSRQVTDYGQVRLQDDLMFALEREQFELYYQPQVNLRSGSIIGAEALIRWNHPTRGLVGPVNFIPKLEETGMIQEVGDWVLKTACQQLKYWTGMSSEFFSMSVNLSSEQLKPQTLAKRVDELLSQFQLNPASLELELTESIVIGNLPEDVAVLIALKEIGVRLSVDDFGTGYSGLSYLQNFPFDIIKIDREFIRNITLNNKFTAIILAIINLADDLDMVTIAEGVENREEFDYLKQYQCDIVQGFYFSPAVTAETFTDLLQSGRTFEVEAEVSHLLESDDS
jgi:EAL domain-containing protein (putative c-di-GMP-specific phosphodiesterase class I)/AmiR/NasT family two-component response regulator